MDTGVGEAFGTLCCTLLLEEREASLIMVIARSSPSLQLEGILLAMTMKQRHDTMVIKISLWEGELVDITLRCH